MSAAEKIRRLNRLYAVSSGINEAIVRVPDEHRLFEEACRIAVERGGFMMAWVGRDDPQRGELVPVARWGKDAGYVDAIRIRTDPLYREGMGPGGTAFRTGLASVCNDIEADDARFAYRAQALAHGYRSCAAFPLKLEGRPVAVFFVYAAVPLYFDDEELALLTSLAENFSFALDAREQEAQRQRMEQALRASESGQRDAIRRLQHQQALLDMASRLGRLGAWEVELPSMALTWSQELNVIHDLPPGRSPSFAQAMEFCVPEHRPAVGGAFAACVSEGTPFDLEMEILTAAGRRLSVRSIGEAVRDASGAIVRVQGAFQDITDTKQAEAEILRLNAELESRVRQRTGQLELANRELQAFSYSVAHDLRAPLAAIGGFGHALERELAPVAGERALHYLSRMREGVLRTSDMIDALLSLAQLSRAELRWEAVDLSSLAAAAARSCREQAPAREADFHIQPGLAAHGDPRLLQLVMDNLIGNAWKFTMHSPRAEISVTAQPGAAGETVYSVRDNGVGFETAYAHNLFGAFQRLHTEAEFAGSGIGLANVRRILSRHSGRIWADSQPGRGATFFFTLGDEPA